MNRKEFIVKSAGSIAALSLSNLLLGKTRKNSSDEEEDLIFYKAVKETKNGSVFDVEYVYELPASVVSCEAGSFTLKVSQLPEGVSDEALRQEAKYTIAIKKCKSDKEGIVASMKCKKYQLVEGVNLLKFTSLDKCLKKKTILNLMLAEESDAKYMVTVLKRKTELLTLLELHEIIDMEGDDDCYLTTVCVNYLGKDDACNELQTLRSFRDTYVRTTEKGEEWVRAYYKTAPSIVKKINESEFRDQILEKMYVGLVLPTLSLIDEGEEQKAMDYYISYALTMQDLMGETGKLLLC
jgi:hypothetical protein